MKRLYNFNFNYLNDYFIVIGFIIIIVLVCL